MKKRLFLLLSFSYLAGQLLAQDVLILKTGEEIECWITEIAFEDIKYESVEYIGEAIRSIPKSLVFVILYDSGKREVLVKPQPEYLPPPSETSYAESEEIRQEAVAEPVFREEDPYIDEKPRKEYKGNYFMIGTGYGYSYGGLGIMLQGRFGGNVGVGIHGGVGYFPNAPVLASGGVKFYPYKGAFIDAQFGLVGWEEYYYWDSWGYTDESGQLLYGPSLLTGCEWTWGRKVGFGFHVAIGASYYINGNLISGFNIAYDMGFVMRF